ncbi:Bug family tripartite tricarboxylate transporter substrate binding protein [Xylophilus sp. ASV27]|uniref:Bug family tripartite tricarboxylate transporter substrate binding protein n=1 Tax=Xylophilus sp. ASV27 TaxID=2795129 RepID=UPI0018EBE3B3|nr:tripartite tricarboxylate transporter substrate binding protein [Xylophilus sp. ASV27]
MYRALACAALAALSTSCMAETWPSKAISIVVPFGAGGNTDAIARLTANYLTKALNTSVIVDNRPGAAGLIAAKYVLGAPADGYTLLMGTASQLITAPFVNANFNYDAVKDFAPVVNIGANAFVLTARPSLPVKNLADFIALAQREPGKLTYGSGGTGSVTHISAYVFTQKARIELTHIPYKGGAAALTDLLGGQIDMYSASPSEVIPQANSGKLKLLAISSPTRLKELPKVPTIAETFPGYEVSTWNGLVARAGTQPEILDRIAAEVVKMKDDPALVKSLEEAGVVPVFTPRSAFAEQIRNETVTWGKVLKNSGIRAD